MQTPLSAFQEGAKQAEPTVLPPNPGKTLGCGCFLAQPERTMTQGALSPQCSSSQPVMTALRADPGPLCANPSRPLLHPQFLLCPPHGAGQPWLCLTPHWTRAGHYSKRLQSCPFGAAGCRAWPSELPGPVLGAAMGCPQCPGPELGEVFVGILKGLALAHGPACCVLNSRGSPQAVSVPPLTPTLARTT